VAVHVRHLRAGALFATLAIAAVDVAACLVAIEDPPAATGTGAAAGATSAAGADAATGGATGGDGGSAASSSSRGGSGGCGDGSYPDEVLCDQPVGYWRLDDADPLQAEDSSGHERHGVYQGDVTLQVSGAPLGAGAEGNLAAVFHGGHVELAADVLDFSMKAPFTLEAWILAEAQDGGVPKNGAIAGKLVYASGYSGYVWPVHEGALRLHRTHAGVSSNDTVDSTTPVPVDVFTHVVTRFDGATIRHFFDGVEVGSGTGAQSMPDIDEPFTIGDADNWGPFAGVIDEVAVYDYALHVDRIEAHYLAATSSR
jgi:hypothetical protein